MPWPSPTKIFRWLCAAVFWGWNISFLVLAVFGILPWLGLAATMAVLEGELSGDFLVSAWLLVLVPAASLLLAPVNLRVDPGRQMRWFYGCEAPIFLLCLVRLLALRELTAGSAFLIGGILVAALLYGYQLLRPLGDSRRLALAANSLLLVQGIYTGLLLLIYALPFGTETLKFFFGFEWLKAFIELLSTPGMRGIGLLQALWWMTFGLAFGLFSIALFVVAPLALATFYLQAWYAAWVQARQTDTVGLAVGVSATVVAVWLALWGWSCRQPQAEAFALLAEPASSQAQKRTLLHEQEAVREGLVNAYLYRYRYLNAKKQVDHVRGLYQHAFGWTSMAAQPVQDFYNLLLAPLLYDGDGLDDSKAAQLYADFFDRPIQKGEQQAVIDALQATADRAQAQAGLLDANQQKVRLAAQNVAIRPNGAALEVEVYEKYANQTLQRQEIYYYFALPPNAVPTGLWLGETAERDRRQAYSVAPRGAAQKVYNRQVRERADPALLEQVGPRQYRLRAFPIPPKAMPYTRDLLGRSWNPGGTQSTGELHLWFTYSVLPDGEHPILPALLEKRNVYWDGDSQRSLNGAAVQSTDWMPPAPNPVRPAETALEAVLAMPDNGYTLAAHFDPQPETGPVPAPVAVLIDSSYSMREQRRQLSEALAALRKLAPGAAADVYVQSEGEAPRLLANAERELDSLVFFGSLGDGELWNQAAAMRHKPYRGIFVLTDRGSYELSQTTAEPEVSVAPVWYVHFGQLAPAYEDNVMRALLRSGGGVETDLETAWRHWLANDGLPPEQRRLGAYRWHIAARGASAETGAPSPLAPLAAKVFADYWANRQDAPDLAAQDALHRLAVRHSVVTPYSSLLVLVNDNQREQLKKAEDAPDRFERSVESGIETMSSPVVTAVPEPETWLLLGLAALLLAVQYYRGKRSSGVKPGTGFGL